MALIASAAYPGQTVQDIVIDPDYSQTAYVIDSDRVFMTVDADYVSISFGGATYMAQTVVFSDAPGMVQINPDGSLANEVNRKIGHATALMLSEVLS